MNDMSFTSRRVPMFEAEAIDPAPVASTASASQELQRLQTRTIVLSGTPGLAEMVARGLARDENLAAMHRTAHLADFAHKPGLDLGALDLIVFEIRAEHDADLAALRDLATRYGDGLQFLGVTGEALTLSTARKLMDAGVAEVIPLTSTQPTADHAANLGALTAQAQLHAEAAQAQIAPARAFHEQTNHDGMILAVASACGGIGATSFVLNLATLLAQQEKKDRTPAKRVAVVDLDFQNGVLGASIDVFDGGAYLDLLREQTLPNKAFLRDVMIPHTGLGIDVMPAPVTLAPLDAMSADMVAALLDELRLSYDFIVLDLPRALVDWLDPILARADRLFILGNSAVHTVRQTRRMIDLYTDEHAALPIEVVMSKEKKQAASSVKEAEHFLDRRFSAWLPEDAKSASRARDYGQPIALARPKSPVIKAMQPMITGIRASFASQTRRRP